MKNTFRLTASSSKTTLKFGFLGLLMMFLSACQTYKLHDGWPEELPNQKLFIDGYLKKRGLESATDQQLSYHLGWIKKFYQGTTLYPNGWLNASSRFIATIDNENDKREINQRMKKLGVLIANEWAQDNKIRLINSSNMATWADAMRTAAERNEQTEFVKKVEDDVASLLEGKINSRNINYERYFKEETYDDF